MRGQFVYFAAPIIRDRRPRGNGDRILIIRCCGLVYIRTDKRAGLVSVAVINKCNKPPPTLSISQNLSPGNLRIWKIDLEPDINHSQHFTFAPGHLLSPQEANYAIDH